MTFDCSFRLPRFVLLRVSGAMPTLKESEEGNSVTVRHVPLIHMLSPSFASLRIEEASEMIREVPLPPDSVSSNC